MQEKKNVLYIIYVTRSEKIKIFIKKSGKVGEKFVKNILNLYFFCYKIIKEALFSVREAMKKISLILTSLVCITAAFGLASCNDGGGGDPSIYNILFITSLMKKMIITELLILIVKDKKEAISYLM